jgi:SAM-dependent methyltransferase
VGCGAGFLFPHYPATIGRLIGVEPDPVSRSQAVAAAALVRTPIVIVGNHPDGRLPLPDACADFVVCSEVLCSVTDPAAMLREIDRILRPGGELRILEHTLSPGRYATLLRRAADKLGWPRLFGGCHVSRDVPALVTTAGFTWQRIERYWFTHAAVMWPTGPHVRGVAKRF